MTTILSSLGYRQIKVVTNDYVQNCDDLIFRLYDNAAVTLSRTDSEDYNEYQEWLAEGNTPLPADPIPEPEPLTPQQKLEAAGLTVEELRELLGL